MELLLKEDLVILFLKLTFKQDQLHKVNPIKRLLNTFNSTFNLPFPFKNITKHIFIERERSFLDFKKVTHNILFGPHPFHYLVILIMNSLGYFKTERLWPSYLWDAHTLDQDGIMVGMESTQDLNKGLWETVPPSNVAYASIEFF